MFEKLDNCPSCGHPKFSNYLITTDYPNTGESFATVKCEQCDLIFTNPRPTSESISKYYEGDYISHTNNAQSLINVIYKLVRTYSLRKKQRIINHINKGPGTLLDFGCGTGHFLELCQSKKWEIQGLEPNDNARSNAAARVGKRVYKELQELDFKVDMVTAWHVLEHVHDLKLVLRALRKLLVDKGHILIAVPNMNSFDAKHYQAHWAALDVPRHLYHFTQPSFKLLAKECSLKVVDVLPMKFDSFYASILSEKYKKGNLMNGLQVGLKSNRLASKNGEYSSLIYVLSK